MRKDLKASGTVTVFLCLTFTLILSILMILLETAHVRAMNFKTRSVSYTALNSLFSNFSLPLYEQFGLFGVNGTKTETATYIQNEVNRNFSMPAGLSGFYCDFFKINSFDSAPSKLSYMTDDNGTYFARQIIDFMKYQAPVSTLDFLSGISFVTSEKKKSIDLSSLDSEDEETVDDSYPLSEFSDDAVDDTERKEDDAKSEKKSIIEKAQEFLSDPSLTIYLGNTSGVSSYSQDLSSLPSVKCSYSKKNTVLKSYSDQILYLLYLSKYFSDYTKSISESKAFQYELEYLLSGKSSDEENLSLAIQKLQLLRTELNLAYLYTDTAKRTEAHSVATAAVGLIPIPLIVEFTQLAIMSAWAYMEAVADVRTLLAGDKIPLFKSKQDWTLSLSGILVFDGNVKSKSSGRGLSYRQYLFLFLFQNLDTAQIYRAMDLIELTIQKKYDSSFKMRHCLISAGFAFEYEYRPVFVLPNLPYKKNSIFFTNFNLTYGF